MGLDPLELLIIEDVATLYFRPPEPLYAELPCEDEELVDTAPLLGGMRAEVVNEVADRLCLCEYAWSLSSLLSCEYGEMYCFSFSASAAKYLILGTSEDRGVECLEVEV